jgi:hypothetical protein
MTQDELEQMLQALGEFATRQQQLNEQFAGFAARQMEINERLEMTLQAIMTCCGQRPLTTTTPHRGVP